MENSVKTIEVLTFRPSAPATTTSGSMWYELELNESLSGYPKAKLIAHLEKSLNQFINKTKKEEVL